MGMRLSWGVEPGNEAGEILHCWQLAFLVGASPSTCVAKRAQPCRRKTNWANCQLTATHRLLRNTSHGKAAWRGGGRGGGRGEKEGEGWEKGGRGRGGQEEGEGGGIFEVSATQTKGNGQFHGEPPVMIMVQWL